MLPSLQIETGIESSEQHFVAKCCKKRDGLGGWGPGFHKWVWQGSGEVEVVSGAVRASDTFQGSQDEYIF